MADAAGNQAEASSAFQVDATPPVVVIATPADGLATNQPSIPVTGAATDQNLAAVTVNGVAAELGAPQPDPGGHGFIRSFTASVPIVQGANPIVVTATDAAGNAATAQVSVIGDTTPPTIALVAPAENAFLPTGTPAVQITYADETALDLDTLEVVAGGADVSAALTKTATSASGTVPAEAALAEGAQYLTARIRDRAGNEASVQRLFYVDLTAPQLVVVSPGDQTWTNQAAIEVRGGVIDASPVTVRVEGVEATVAGSEFTAAGVPVGGADGTDATLTVVATDAAGHTGQTTLTLHVNRTPPVVTLTSPAAGDVVQGPVVDVAGTVSDASPVTLSLNGDVIPVGAGGLFTGQVAAGDGAVSIQAVAVDAAGNTGAASLGVTFDSVPPAIAITAPADGLVTRDDRGHRHRHHLGRQSGQRDSLRTPCTLRTSCSFLHPLHPLHLSPSSSPCPSKAPRRLPSRPWTPRATPRAPP